MQKSKNSAHVGRPPIGDRAMTAAERVRKANAERRARGDVEVIVDLPEELVQRVRSAAAERGKRVQNVVVDALDAAM